MVPMDDVALQLLYALERTVRDLEVDVAAIIHELRENGHPNLLQGKPAYVGHRAVLTEETRTARRRRNIALARSSKPIGTGKGAIRDPETKRRLRRDAR